MANNIHGKDDGVFLRSANVGCMQGLGCVQIVGIFIMVSCALTFLGNLFGK